MPRVFACLAAADFLLFLIAGSFGFAAEKVRVERHILLAVATLLLSCLIQVAAFTYLTVTGKMMAQAVHLGRLDPTILDRVRRLKKSMTGCVAMVFFPSVVLVATGASAWRTGDGVWLHYGSAAVVLLAHGVAWVLEFDLIRRNKVLFEMVLGKYESSRRRAAEPTIVVKRRQITGDG